MKIWLILCLVVETVFGEKMVCPIICRCTDFEASTICSKNGLIDLPENIYKKVRYLDLSYNSFTEIPRNLSTYKYLQRISFRHNKISALDSSSLQNLTNLRELDLSMNTFTIWSDIDSKLLSPLKSLQSLDFSNNDLKGFPILSSSSLQTLKLANCSIRALQSNTFNYFHNLTTLDLSENYLGEIIVRVKSKSLIKLNLTSSSIRKFFGEHLEVNFPKLKTLYLARNYELVDFNANSSTLEHLDVSDCNLETIRESYLPKLVTLDINSNRLRKLNETFFQNMPNVTIVNFTNNVIQEVDSSTFKNLMHVKQIDLSYNTISKIDAGLIFANKRLEKLYLSHNYLNELPSFQSKSLSFLDISECEISRIGADSLVKLPSLSSINLSRNMFKTLPINFTSQSLRKLDVSYCRITNLKNDTFKNLVNLNTLNLIGNRLVSINFDFLHNINVVRLADNSWRCECDNKDFKDLYLKLTKINSDVDRLTCTSPERYESFFWYEACGSDWFSISGLYKERAWIYIFCGATILSAVLFILVSLNKSRRRKQERLRQREEERREASELLRRINMRANQNLNRNAPDPREQERPPSYNEALTMQTPAGSLASLNSRKSMGSKDSLNNNRRKPRRKRRKSKSRAAEQSEVSRNSDSDEPRMSIYMESDI